MNETIYEKNLKEFKDRLLSGKLDKLDEIRIANFISRYPNKHWTRESVIEDCLANEKLCAKMAKDGIKQNLDEAKIIAKIGAEKLPPSGKNNIRFKTANGELVIGQKADNIHRTVTKSADFKMIYKGDIIYGTQKSIHGKGGHQDSQVRDAIEFVQAGNIKHKAIAVIDGYNVDNPRVYTSEELIKKKNKEEDLV